MRAEGVGWRPQRRPRKIDEDVSNPTAKRRRAVRRDDIPCARCGSARRDHAQHAHRRLDRVLGSDGADEARGLSIAADGDVKVCATCLRPHPHVGRHRVEMKHATAIDRDGNFWTDVGGESRCRNRATQVRGNGARIDRFLGIEARERIGQHRRSFANG